MIIATTSSALFDLTVEDQIFRECGEKAYSEYQIEHENIPLHPGPAFALVSKLLALNGLGMGDLVEVILLSRNSADSGLRVMNSIAHYGLNIPRAAFSCGASRGYAHAFGVSLFLSTNAEDVKAALSEGIPAAMIAIGAFKPTHQDIRIAFDGDAVIFSDESEKIFQENGLDAFNANERERAQDAMSPGPLKPFLDTVHALQAKFAGKPCPIRTALITARGAPAHERVIRTLRSWNIRIDEMLFLAGRDKAAFCAAFAADIMFDDTRRHIESIARYNLAGHVLAGTNNP